MNVRMRAGLLARRRVFVVLLLILIERRMVHIEGGAMIVRRMAVQPVMPVRMRIERRQDARITVDAADADGDGNHKKTQKLASH